MLGLYIHIPFCISKCPYCDFYSLSGVSEDTMQRYADSVCRCMSGLASELDLNSRPADSIYFGGGTPSLMTAGLLEKILSSAEKCLRITSPQICLEINPATADPEYLSDCRSIGIDRISVGMQSADDMELKKLGRIHRFSDVKKTVSDARKAGIDDISLDLMLGTPGQNMPSLKKSVEACAALGADHVSAYMLKIEPDTPFGRKPPGNIAGDDELSDMYLSVCEWLDTFGFRQYEISNWAKDGKRSRHNMKYWNCEEYLGIGPGAHSFINGRRFYYGRDLDGFMSGAGVTDDGTGGGSDEYIMLRLRLNDGLLYDEYAERFGAFPDKKYIERAGVLAGSGLAAVTGEGFYLTRQGMLVSNPAIGFILTGK